MSMWRATTESPKMFESPFLDFFSRTHPAVVPAVFLPIAVGLLWKGGLAGLGVAPSVLLFAGGLVFWSLAEYWLHRTFFHWEPPGKWGQRLHFLVHGVHHQWPKDRYRLVMPPAASLLLFFTFLGLFWLALGPTLVWPFHAGFVVGYTTYDLTHFYLHHYNPRSAYGLKLKKHHMLHHFKTKDARFGVSSMVWDSVFGTRGT